MTRKTEKGFTLVEICVVAFLFIVGMMGVMQVFNVIGKGSITAKCKTAANNLALEKIRYLKGINEKQLTSNSEFGDLYSPCNPYPPEFIKEENTVYTRFVKIGELKTDNLITSTTAYTFVGWYDNNSSTTTNQVFWKDFYAPGEANPNSVLLSALLQFYHLNESTGMIAGRLFFRRFPHTGANYDNTAPLPGATVRLKEKPQYTTKSDGGGRFEFVCATGTYTLIVFGASPDTGGELELEQSPYTVSEGAALNVGDLTFPNVSGSLYGTITRAGVPLNNVNIVVCPTMWVENNVYQFGLPIRDAQTNFLGNYLIGLQPGYYKVWYQFGNGRFETVRVTKGSNVRKDQNFGASATAFSPSSDPDDDHVPGYDVSGQLKEVGSGKFLANVQVQIANSEALWYVWKGTPTFAIANANLEGLNNTEISVVANSNQANSSYASSVVTTHYLTGNHQQVEVALIPVGHVSGKVLTDGSDKPLSGYTVIAQENGNQRGKAVTGSDGCYTIKNLPLYKNAGGVYQNIYDNYLVLPVLNSLDEEVTRPYPARSFAPVLSTGAVNANLDFKIKINTSKIVGVVKDSEGKLVTQGAIIMITERTIDPANPPDCGKDGDPSFLYYATISDSDGKYSVKVKKGKIYRLYAWYWNKNACLVSKAITGIDTSNMDESEFEKSFSFPD